WFHQVPLWNPWTCGGQVYLANPQSLVAQPTFVLPLLFGTALGTKLLLVAYFFFAFDGLYRLGRAHGLSIAAARLASVLFGAVRMLPAFECAVDHPRHVWETDRNNPLEMSRNPYWWRGIEPVGGHRYYFHEYGLRLPYLTPPLILWSLKVRRTRWLWSLVLV